MTIYDNYNESIPEYYKTMHLDGYSPEQILQAARKKIIQDHEERQEDTVPDVSVASEVNIK